MAHVMNSTKLPVCGIMMPLIMLFSCVCVCVCDEDECIMILMVLNQSIIDCVIGIGMSHYIGCKRCSSVHPHH